MNDSKLYIPDFMVKQYIFHSTRLRALDQEVTLTKTATISRI